MSGKNTWLWVFIAGCLFVFIFFFEGRLRKPTPGPIRVLPNLNVASVTSVQIDPANVEELRAERTNGVWMLTRPTLYPAQSERIHDFLEALARLTAAVYITPAELKDHPNADEEYGFFSSQATVILEPDNRYLQFGKRTVPGDQVFARVVGGEGIYVVDAGFLKIIPTSPEDWRDTALINLRTMAFDRVAVTNASSSFVLQRDPASRLWRILPPIQERADSVKIDAALEVLQAVRINGFVSDDPKSDLDRFGLQPPSLELDFGQDTNVALVLQFGASPTNDARKVFARRPGQTAIFTVPAAPLSVWREKAEAFRDPHLVEFPVPVVSIEVRADDIFTLQKQGTNSWRVMPEGFPADAFLVDQLLDILSQSTATLVKGVVIEPDLAGYGLAPPHRIYRVEAPASAAPGATNTVVAELDFGTNEQDKVFARRLDENAVYAIKTSDYGGLPSKSWEMRDRTIWNVSTNDIASLTIRQHGRVRQIIRNKHDDWSLAPGSQGIINPGAIEGAALELARLNAERWIARGGQNLARYGLAGDTYQLSLQVKSGDQFTLAVGGPSPPDSAYAAVTLNGEPWIFELPPRLWQFIVNYLAVPVDTL